MVRNIGTDIHNEPRLFDPSLYYGDYEADITMTELFSGFDQKFYEVIIIKNLSRL